ncbi:MAG: 3-phosphoshikimate 1-carboxyvinyltransferase [Bacteroidales bacterium]
MYLKVFPSFIEGNIQVPSSKSYTQRAFIASLLSNGSTEILNPGRSEDDNQMLSNIEKLGAEISLSNEKILIKGGLHLKQNQIHAGESGLGIRLITAVTALLDTEITITGTGTLQNRPMQVMEKALSQLGAHCQTNNGYLPIKVKGPIKGGTIETEGSLSSQFLSGLLFALPLAIKDSTVHINNLKSRPYIDMTLNILDTHGIKIINTNYQKFVIQGNQEYKPTKHLMEGDWSNGAFLLVAGAINGNLKVSGLNPSSLQGDKKVLEALRDSGVDINQTPDYFKVEKAEVLKAFEFNATETPDLFPPLACLAAYCKGTSHIKGVSRLKHKESNRTEALIKEFTKMGIHIQTSEHDTLQITGGRPRGGNFFSHNDHRIAMAGAILGLKSKEPIIIEGYRAVTKSYPGFFEDLNKLNVKIEKKIQENGNQ